MTNLQKILTNNAKLEECIATTNDLPSAGYLGDVLNVQDSIIGELEDTLAQKAANTAVPYEGTVEIVEVT